MIGYLGGLAVHYQLGDLHQALILFTLLSLLSLLLYQRSKPLSVHCAGAALALLVATLSASQQLDSRLALQDERIDVELTGTVRDLSQSSDLNFQRLTLDLTVAPAGFPQLKRVRLNAYRQSIRMGQGDYLHVEARITAPITLRNKQSPDRTAQALRLGIDAQGYIRRVLEHESNPSVRQRLSDWLGQHFDSSSTALLRALTLGDTQSLSADQWQLLKDTGTVHLVVISGLHLGVLVLAGLGAGRVTVTLWRMAGFRSNIRFERAFPILLAALCATLFLFIGGQGIALQRAWIMALVLLAALLLDRRPSIDHRLKGAVLLVTVLDPLAVSQLGFWLSFGLVFLLARVAQLRGTQDKVRSVVTIQAVLTLLSLPLLVFSTGQINLSSFITNLWAIPLMSALVVCLPLLLCLSAVSDWVVARLEGFIEFYWDALGFHAALGLNQSWPSIDLFLLLVGTLGAALIFLPVRMRVLGLVLLTLALFQRTDRPAEGEFWIDILDVGQGQSAVIRTAQQTWVYDTGAAFPSGYTRAQATLEPFLTAAGVRTLDGLILSHSDIDHSGGAERIIERFQPTQVISGQPERTGGTPCKNARVEHPSGVHLSLMKQPALNSKDNNESCALLVSNGQCRFLVMGDLDARHELRLAEHHQLSEVNWLHLSHHGSRSSTSRELLDLLDPQQVFVSRGAFNRYQHPAQSVYQRVAERGIELFDTAQTGQIRLVATDQECRVETERDRKRRYWDIQL